MSTADDFVNSLSEAQFTYRRARDWLVTLHYGRSVYQSQIYDLIINPLLQKGIIIRVGRGLYVLARGQPGGKEREALEPDVGASGKDEFDVYLREKGVKP